MADRKFFSASWPENSWVCLCIANVRWTKSGVETSATWFPVRQAVEQGGNVAGAHFTLVAGMNSSRRPPHSDQRPASRPSPSWRRRRVAPPEQDESSRSCAVDTETLTGKEVSRASFSVIDSCLTVSGSRGGSEMWSAGQTRLETGVHFVSLAKLFCACSEEWRGQTICQGQGMEAPHVEIG